MSLGILMLTAIVLIPLEMKFEGWILFVAGVAITAYTDKTFRQDILLIYGSLGLLGITPITTDISPLHMTEMGILLSLAVAIPYLISRFVYKEHTITFKFHHGRSWYKKEIGYIFFAAVVSYLAFPYLLRETGSYMNWSVELGAMNLFILFLGTNALGIWDELFFVNTVLGLLRRHLPFQIANLIQAVLFTAFLYELGFRGFMFPIIYIFALLQGFVFKKTESLFYIITIHLTVDLILYLVLIHLHHPELLKFFIT